MTVFFPRLTLLLSILAAPILLVGQSYQLSLESGTSEIKGDAKSYVSQGFNAGFSVSREFCKGLSANAGYSLASFAADENYNASENWRASSLFFGPSYQLNYKKLSFSLGIQAGIGFLRMPQQNVFYQNTGTSISSFQEVKNHALSLGFSTALSTEICEGLSVYFKFGYRGNVNGDIAFRYQDISFAINPDGTVDQDKLSEIAFQEERLSIQHFNYSFGLSISLAKQHSRHRATDYNSSRSNRTTSRMSSEEAVGYQQRATDYNSSRSNRSTSAIDTPDEGDTTQTRATDYNSSRSNKSYSVLIVVDSTQQGSRATDYNSSRSNKSFSAFVEELTEGGGARATDYNSSRSNKSFSVLIVDEDMSNSRATDYNSSRSNKNFNVFVEEEKPDYSRATDYNSSRSNKSLSVFVEDKNEGGARATDYNSSRSNKSYGIFLEELNEENDLRATDYNSSRSNKSYSVNIEDKNSGEIIKIRGLKANQRLKLTLR